MPSEALGSPQPETPRQGRPPAAALRNECTPAWDSSEGIPSSPPKSPRKRRAASTPETTVTNPPRVRFLRHSQDPFASDSGHDRPEDFSLSEITNLRALQDSFHHVGRTLAANIEQTLKSLNDANKTAVEY